MTTAEELLSRLDGLVRERDRMLDREGDEDIDQDDLIDAISRQEQDIMEMACSIVYEKRKERKRNEKG